MVINKHSFYLANKNGSIQQYDTPPKNIPINKINLDKILGIIKQIAFNNGESADIIDKLLRKKQFGKTINSVYP